MSAQQTKERGKKPKPFEIYQVKNYKTHKIINNLFEAANSVLDHTSVRSAPYSLNFNRSPLHCN